MGDERGDITFTLDLSATEVARRAAVLEAYGDTWDPAVTLEDERRAYALLYSGLDAEQRRVYDELVSAGVLPNQRRDEAC